MLKIATVTIAAVIVGTGMGLVANRADSTLAEPAVEEINVLVARKDIEKGTLIANPSSFFESQRIRNGDQLEGAVTSFDSISGRRIRENLTKGQPLTAADFWESTLQTRNAKGFQSFNIKVAVDAKSIDLLPRCRVDVVALTKAPNGHLEPKTLLENVLILAIDQAQRRAPNGETLLESTVTLELKTVDAEQLEELQKQGTEFRLVRSAT